MKKHGFKTVLSLILAGLMTTGAVFASAETTETPAPTDFNDELCLYYDFDGEGDAAWKDKAGSFAAKPAKTVDGARVYEGVTAATAAGKTGYGKALTLPITDGYLAIPDGFMDTVGNADATFSFWFKGTTAMANFQTVVAFGDDELKKKITFHGTAETGNPLGVWIQQKDGTEFHLLQTENAVASNDETWHLYTLTITRGTEADAAVFYVDGVKKAEKTDVKLPDYQSGAALNVWNQIGRSWWNEAPTGQLDDLRVYTKALSADAILELKNAETAPAAPEPADLVSDLKYHFTFDFDNVGRDSVSKYNIMEETGEITRVAEGGPLNGKYGKFGTFDGIFTYGLLNDNVLNGVTSEMSVSMWVKPDKLKPYVRLFDVGLGTKFFSVIMSNTDDPEWGRVEAVMTTDGWFGQPGTTFTSAYNDEKVIKKGEWNHVAVTVKDKEMIVYVNGKKICSTTNLVDFSDIGEATENYVGMSRFAQDALYEGAMDELRVYARGLSASEVKQLNAGNTPANTDDGTGGGNKPDDSGSTVSPAPDTSNTDTDGSPKTGAAAPLTGALLLSVMAVTVFVLSSKRKK